MTTIHPSPALWRKSSRSGGDSGQCVEVAALGRRVGLRDSKDPHGPVLSFSTDAWRAFAARVKAGRLDLG